MKRLPVSLLSCCAGLLLHFVTGLTFAADAPASDPARDREMRDRYEKVLLKNPFQERAFNQVYESYSKIEGVEKWVESLRPKIESDDGLAALLVLGQVYDRQFKTAEAIKAFEQAVAKGENRPQFKVLLGTLYYKAGQDDKAATFLSAALDSLTDLDQRSLICRMLGNLYLRQGKRDEAMTVWKRIVEQNPKEIFSQLELAEIYEDNRMWSDAIAVYEKIAGLSTDDPYRRCRALRSIGQCLVRAEKFQEAIATYERALELVAPGNWLFEDIKLRLVGVYEDIGDLAGLVNYVTAKLDQNANDNEFRDLLAETYLRMAKFDDAEKQYRTILERNPRSSPVHEKLVSLYTRTGKTNEVVATFEKLIEFFPTDSDYLRRLGEFHLHNGTPEKAKETWRRVLGTSPGAEKLATLAGWFESYEFPDDAAVLYQQAIEKTKNKEWILRLATLHFQKGDETGATKLWLSVIDPATSKVEDYAEVASILEANQKLDEAVGLRQAAVAKDGENLESRLAYAKLLMRRQKWEEALPQFEALAAQDQNEFMMQQGEMGCLDAWRELELLDQKQKQLETELTATPNDARKLGQLARLYERSGQREKAIALYEARREKEPDNVTHLRALGALYKNGKQTEQAITTFKALLDKDKNRARVYQKELLDIYLSVDLKDEAIAAAEQMVSLAPSDPEMRLALAQVYQLYRLPDKALNEYRFALRLEPQEPDYHRQYGDALEQEKRYGEAQEAYRRMLDTAKEDSTRLSAVANLARIHLQQDRLAELTTEFQRRIRNTPKKLAAYEELAAIHKESGQIVRGVEVLESGLQSVDDKAAALKSLIRMGHEAQDFPKVKSYYEQLVAMSGKPSANEFEKLGQIYAQLGEVEKAKATWNKIVVVAAKDPKAHDRVAKLLQEQGFTDEALAMKAKAVELEPADYKRRFEYAQMLGQNQQSVQAMDQVRLLLEIGDREEKKEEKGTEKKVQRVSKGQQGPGTISPYQFMSSGRYYGRYYGSGWQGGFKDFRPSVLQFMASLAQQSIGEDAFLEQLQERARKPGATIETKRDLLTILQMFNRIDEAIKIGAEVLAGSPNDPDLLQIMALLYSNQQDLEKAIPLLEKIAQSQPKQRLVAAGGLVPLYIKNKQDAKAVAIVDALLKENPTDTQTYYTLSGILQNSGKFEESKRVLLKLKEVDPRQSDQVRNQLANLAKQTGKLEEARILFREALFAESVRPSYYGPSKRVEIYLPELEQNQGRSYSNPMQGLPSAALGGLPWDKISALTELKLAQKSSSETETNILDEIAQVARAWSPSAPPNQRDRSWSFTRLLVAQYAVEKEFDKATALLTTLRQAGLDEAAWFNASLYIAQQREDFPAMQKLYDELQQRYPAKARDIALGRAHTWLLAKKYDDAARIIRNLNEQRVPPSQILGLIAHLQRVGEKKLAKQLLEEHLSGVSRNPQALSMLASLYGEENDFDKAISLANEAWERKAHGTPGSSYYYAPVYYGYMPQFNQVDNLLNDLHRYYVGAGKSDDLIERFKQALEKQPASVQAHENLASLYRFGQERDKALEIYQQLTEKRPHLLQAKRTIAGLYQEMGQFELATKLYEDLIKANPNLYQSFQWELREVYQRQGKGKELQKMEDNIATKVRDPNQLMQLASRMKEDGDLDKAIDLFRKAAKMSPGQGYYQSQYAAALLEKGLLDEALKAYEEWFNSPQLRGQNWVDHYTIRQFVGLYKATGKLDDLKKRCESDLLKNSADRTARALQAHIAFLEKRYDDALTGFKAMLDSGADPNIVSQLIELAGFSGKFKDVLAIAERADSRQGSWDSQQLANLYLAAGDKKKAAAQTLKWAEQMIQQGNGSWALRQTLEQLSQMELWEEVEQFVSKHRTDNMDQWEAEEFDRTIATRYVNEGRFRPVVDVLLTKESLKGRDLSLVQKIAEQLSSQPIKRRDFLEKLVAADPKNRDLAFTLAQLLQELGDLPGRLTVLQPLVEADPAKPEYRRALAETLIDLGRSDEALRALGDWAKEKPGEQRWTLLSQMQAKAGQTRLARESLVKAFETADKTRKTEVQLQLARFDSQNGDVAAERAALKANFLARKDAGTFQGYWKFLDDHGWAAEAHDLFVTNKDSGYFGQFQQTDFVTVCLNQSDYSAAADLNWRFTRYGNRWERDWYFDRVMKVYRDRGKIGWFVNDFAKRIEEDKGANPTLLDRLARSWDQGGYPEKALSLYNRQLEQNPFNRNAAQNKANLLVKLGQTDDALLLLRDAKGLSTLDLESTAQISLIESLFRLGRKEEAHREIPALLAWDKRAATLTRLGNLLMDQGESAKAAELFEQADRSVRDWNYEEMLISLAKCRAKLGNVDDLMKLADNLAHSSNADWRLQTLQTWLSAEGFHDLAARVLRGRLAKQPDKLDLHLALAGALQAAGHTNEAFAAFEAAAQAVPSSQFTAIRATLAGSLTDRNLLAEALRRLQAEPTPLFSEAVIEVAAQLGEKSDRLPLLLDAANQLKTDRSESQIKLAQALEKGKRPADAAAWFHRALNSTNEMDRVSAAAGLARLGNDPAVVAILAEALKSKPHWFVANETTFPSYPFSPSGTIYYGMGSPYGMSSMPFVSSARPVSEIGGLAAAAARTHDPVLIQQLRQTLAASSLHATDLDFSTAALLYYQGATNEAQPKLAALIDAPLLTASRLQMLAKLFEDLGHKADQVRVLQRLAGDGYPAFARWMASAQLVKIHSQEGDLARAVTALARLQATWGSSQAEEARVTLADAVSADNYPAFRTAILQTVQANPQADINSELVGLCQQVAQRLGNDESAAKLAAEARLPAWELEEATAWDSLIETWEITGPFRNSNSGSSSFQVYNSDVQNLAPELPEPTIPAEASWRKTDPRRELGVIRIAPVLGLGREETGNQVACARTTIQSPEQRRITLCLGSDDSIQVWVNGRFVHSAMESRLCALDQDRVVVTLKPGANQILLRIGNNSDAWSFCARIAEGGKGIVLAGR